MRPVDEIDNVTPLLGMKKRHDETKEVLLLKMVDKSTSSLQTHFGPVFGDDAVQIGHLTLK